jgi:glycerol-3-phosphate dehydrogenase
MIACTNEYEALTPEAYDVMDEMADAFSEFVNRHPDFTMRELEYLATHAITQKAAEMILRRAVTMRKARRSQ